MEGWRPIETAPKDGTGFLYHEPVSDNHRIVGSGYFDGDCFRAVDFFNPDDPAVTPTHWMPLPTPPAAKEEGNG